MRSPWAFSRYHPPPFGSGGRGVTPPPLHPITPSPHHFATKVETSIRTVSRLMAATVIQAMVL